MSHTPGEWRPYLSQDRPGIEVTLGDGSGVSVIVYGTKDEDDWSGIRGRDDEEAVANAHLISAAPDLLAALKALCAAIDSYDFDGNATGECETARSAIAKAEGRDVSR